MPRKTYRPEEIIATLRKADVLLGEGKKVPEVVKANEWVPASRRGDGSGAPLEAKQ